MGRRPGSDPVRTLAAAVDALPSWLAALAIAALLAGCWGLVFATGGTSLAFPHAFYVPIVVAALPFGVRGGVVTAIAATVLVGPLMPLDVGAGVAQPTGSWLLRGVFFLTIGAASGLATRLLTVGFEQALTDRLREEFAEAASAEQGPDPQARARVAAVLEQRRFHAVFQPIYRLDDGSLFAVEALTRIDAEPSRPPNVWFAEAALVGLGAEFELATASSALEAAGSLPREVTLSLNASPALLADPRFPQLLAGSGRPVIVEVTEHAVVEDYPALEQALFTLREQGVQLAVDDAGAGFASLRHIVRLRPQYIKLDRSLTQGVRGDPIRRALAGALVGFAGEIGSQLIAEGIEEPGDLGAWRAFGAHAAQGYLLGRPSPLPLPDPPLGALVGAARGQPGATGRAST